MRLLHLLLLTIATLLLAGGEVRAQGAFGNGTPYISARLVAESDTPAPGSSIAIAFVMTPEPGWHGYWENPGDAGKGMEVEWSLPEGVTAGALSYPVPETLLISGLMNHVYEGPYGVVTRLMLPASLAAGTRLPIRVKASWLACTDKICVPEGAELSLDLVAGNGAARRAEFDSYLARLPRPLGGQAHFTQSADKLRIAIPYPAAAAISQPWFFRSTDGVKSFAVPQSFSRNGDMLVLEMATSGAVPARLEGVLRIGAHQGLAMVATPGAVPSAGTPIGEGDGATADWRTILLALGGAILGGLILNIMPCVFPILSLKAISLARAGGDERAAKVEALAYAAGVMLTCLALGGALLMLRAGGEQIGWAFQLQNPAVILLLALVAWVIGLNLAGLFSFQAIDAGDDLTRKPGSHGAFWTGALVAFVATPCTGPFMAAALGAALVLPVAAALAIFAGLGLGLALPFLAIAWWPRLRARLPKPGAWMKRFQLWLSVPMLLTTAALLWLVARQAGGDGLGIALALLVLSTPLLWLYGLMQRKGRAAARAVGVLALLAMAGGWAAGGYMLPKGVVAQASHGDDLPFSEAGLVRARASGKPLFLYFTADWCLTCKVNEAAAIDRAEVRAAWERAGVQVMVGDWTNGDAAIGRFLAARGRSGVPLYLWYPAGGGEPRELPQILTPDMLTQLVSEGTN